MTAVGTALEPSSRENLMSTGCFLLVCQLPSTAINSRKPEQSTVHRLDTEACIMHTAVYCLCTLRTANECTTSESLDPDGCSRCLSTYSQTCVTAQHPPEPLPSRVSRTASRRAVPAASACRSIREPVVALGEQRSDRGQLGGGIGAEGAMRRLLRRDAARQLRLPRPPLLLQSGRSGFAIQSQCADSRQQKGAWSQDSVL
jgi:hypothetical protein